MAFLDMDLYIASQYGFLNRTQGVAFYGRDGFDRRVRDGDLVRELQGFYRVVGLPPSPERDLYLATFAYNGVAGVRAAGALHTFDRCGQLRLEVLVKAGVGSRKRKVGPPVVVHRTNYLPEAHVELVRGIPCTTAARTICDLSRHFSASSLGKILDDARRRDLVTYEAVEECRDQLRGRGRRRTTVVDEVLAARGFGFHPGDSEPELKLRGWLVHANLPPVVQHPIIVKGVRRRLDLAYPPERVAVEYQGVKGHSLSERMMDDSQRTTDLQLAGWIVVIVTKKNSRREAVEMVREALRLRGRDC